MTTTPQTLKVIKNKESIWSRAWTIACQWDMTTKCNAASWIGYWNKKCQVKQRKIWINQGLQLIIISVLIQCTGQCTPSIKTINRRGNWGWVVWELSPIVSVVELLLYQFFCKSKTSIKLKVYFKNCLL